MEYNLQDYIAQANSLFTSPAKFVTPNEFNYKLPGSGIPEYAFIGRSNVGKSSLISSLLSEKKLVRVSKGISEFQNYETLTIKMIFPLYILEPGCTTSVNYYTFLRNSNPNSKDSNNHLLYLVDLPGMAYYATFSPPINYYCNI